MPVTTSRVFASLLNQQTGLRLDQLPSKFPSQLPANPFLRPDEDRWSDDLKDLQLWLERGGDHPHGGTAAVAATSAVKSSSVAKSHQLTANGICQHFRTLRFVSKKIDELDSLFSAFDKLAELSLLGNRLESIDQGLLPHTLTSLCLNFNRLSSIPDLSLLTELVHLGIGYNSIARVPDTVSALVPPRLASLDLSYNDIVDVLETRDRLATLGGLRVLSLMGNPVSLAPSYRTIVTAAFHELLYFDEAEVAAGALPLLTMPRLDATNVYINLYRLAGVPELRPGAVAAGSTLATTAAATAGQDATLPQPQDLFCVVLRLDQETALSTAELPYAEALDFMFAYTWTLPLSAQLKRDMQIGMQVSLYRSTYQWRAKDAAVPTINKVLPSLPAPTVPIAPPASASPGKKKGGGNAHKKEDAINALYERYLADRVEVVATTVDVSPLLQNSTAPLDLPLCISPREIPWHLLSDASAERLDGRPTSTEAAAAAAPAANVSRPTSPAPSTITAQLKILLNPSPSLIKQVEEAAAEQYKERHEKGRGSPRRS
ncbi:Leucine-rich repeat-containing protein 43 [Sorochytrium milnesiophthora]